MKDGNDVQSDAFSVRVADLEDAPAIAAVHVATWQRIYRGIMKEPFLDSLRPAQ